jgi:hypothetical protein
MHGLKDMSFQRFKQISNSSFFLKQRAAMCHDLIGWYRFVRIGFQNYWIKRAPDGPDRPIPVGFSDLLWAVGSESDDAEGEGERLTRIWGFAEVLR